MTCLVICQKAAIELALCVTAVQLLDTYVGEATHVILSIIRNAVNEFRLIKSNLCTLRRKFWLVSFQRYRVVESHNAPNDLRLTLKI